MMIAVRLPIADVSSSSPARPVTDGSQSRLKCSREKPITAFQNPITIHGVFRANTVIMAISMARRPSAAKTYVSADTRARMLPQTREAKKTRRAVILCL